MKLWKSKKSSSCVPSSSAGKQQQQQHNDSSAASSSSDNTTRQDPNSSIPSDRAMSPAQSEDSGLAADRSTTYATISLPREHVTAMGILLLDRSDLNYPPVIGSLNALGLAADFLAPGDRIHQIDGISTVGLTNEHVLNVLCNGSGTAVAILEIEYSLPEYLSQNSLCVTTKLAQITVERENGCLGLTLRGGGDFPLIVTNIRPHGPVFRTGRVKPGDRLLRVDNISLINKSLSEAQQILKCQGHLSSLSNLTIEYDVSVMQSVEYSLGPLLIEIERPLNEKLGLILCNYLNANALEANSLQKLDEIVPAGVYVGNILPASIADRCGALAIGDQLLSVDETVIENTSFAPEDVMGLLDASNHRGYTQIQIMPAHAVARRRGLSCGSPKYSGFSTIDSSRKNRQRKMIRKSSMPPQGQLQQIQQESPYLNMGGSVMQLGHAQSQGNGQSSGSSSQLMCRSESIQLVLDCSQGSGLCLAPLPSSKSNDRLVYQIVQIVKDSVADRSGCIQKGDRLLAVNKLYSLDLQTVRQLLGDIKHPNQMLPGGQASANWVELEVEFDMFDSVIPSSGVFNVKLARNGSNGLGITVNATNDGKGSTNSVNNNGGGSGGGGNPTFVITDVKPGSPAHRTGSLRAGDVLLAVDAYQLQHFNVDALLKDTKGDYTTLTIKRTSLPDFLFDTQQRSTNPIYSNATTGGTVVTSKSCSEPRLDLPRASMEKQQQQQPLDIYQPLELESPSYSYVPHPMTQLRRPYIMGESAAAATMERIIPEDPYGEIEGYSEYFQTFYNLEPLPQNSIYNQPQLSTFNGHRIQVVKLETQGGGPLGLTLAGSEDLNKPITISALFEGGVAQQSGKLRVGDVIVAINGETVQGVPLTTATKLLQRYDNFVELKISRSAVLNGDPSANLMSTIIGNGNNNAMTALPQSQAVYAKVQRRPRSPSITDVISNASSKEGTKCTTIHVTLHKDRVYDDYGFSLSDGLYEKGVYINRIRSGGPADVVHLLKPFDRILLVNGTKTKDFDCCLTVPLIAAAGDTLDLIVQRSETD